MSTLAEHRNHWLKETWEHDLPAACKKDNYTPDWAQRSPLWSHDKELNQSPLVVILGINPGYDSKVMDPYCRMPYGLEQNNANLAKEEQQKLIDSGSHRYFGPYQKMVYGDAEFYDLLPVRETKMASVRRDLKKYPNIRKLMMNVMHKNMAFLSVCNPGIVYCTTAWAMELMGLKDSNDGPVHIPAGMINCRQAINCGSYSVNAAPEKHVTQNLLPKPLLVFKGDQLSGQRSASVPTRNRILRDFSHCLGEVLHSRIIQYNS